MTVFCSFCVQNDQNKGGQAEKQLIQVVALEARTGRSSESVLVLLFLNIEQKRLYFHFYIVMYVYVQGLLIKDYSQHLLTRRPDYSNIIQFDQIS